MSLVIRGRHSQLLLRNAFTSMSELAVARAQWSTRANVASYVKEFVQKHSASDRFFGVLISKDNMSICEVNHLGSLWLFSN